MNMKLIDELQMDISSIVQLRVRSNRRKSREKFVSSSWRFGNFLRNPKIKWLYGINKKIIDNVDVELETIICTFRRVQLASKG